jgi:hypothetical protein
MKRVSRIVVFSLVSCIFREASVFAVTTISVVSYGAKCDGATDDTSAIQAALNAAAAAGGGTVTLPSSTCLLNSFAPSSHPWAFYNLHVPSGVTLQGVTGSMLLQGPGGRQRIGNVSGALWIWNTVVAVGNNYSVIEFQNSGNGGFYSLQAMTVGSPSVRLTTAAQATNFAVGDYIAIYEYTSGDVLPAQMSQVTAVNAATGDLTLADSVIRPFAAPSIAKVTSLAAHDIAINNVIVQGAVPLAVTETFNFSASNDQLFSDTSIGGGNLFGLLLNTVEHFTFAGNTIAAINGGNIHQELCQRDSQNGSWTGNTFQDAAVGFEEYAANISMTNNHIYLHPNGTGPDGVSFGGMNVLFSGNDVHTIGNQNNSSGWGFIVADVNAPSSYYSYTGNIQVTNNTIQCVADGNNCLLLVGHGTVVSGNIITATGSATGVYVANSFVNVTNNTIHIGSGTGMTLKPGVLGATGSRRGVESLIEYARRTGGRGPYTPPYAATVTGNTLSGTGSIGIYVGSLPALQSSNYQIYGNTITGFAVPISIDPRR